MERPRPVRSSIWMTAPLQPGLVLRRLEGVRALRQEALQRQLLAHADDRIQRAAHPGVGQVGRPTRQDAFVRRLHVGVAAHHRADPAIEVDPHGVLLARGLAVHVHKDAGRLAAQLLDLHVRAAEGVVEGLHEHAPLEVQDPELSPVRRFDDGAPSARGARRVVRGPEDRSPARVQVGSDLLLVPDVVPAREALDLEGERRAPLPCPRRDPRTVRHVLAVSDRQDRSGAVPPAWAGIPGWPSGPASPPHRPGKRIFIAQGVYPTRAATCTLDLPKGGGLHPCLDRAAGA